MFLLTCKLLHRVFRIKLLILVNRQGYTLLMLILRHQGHKQVMATCYLDFRFQIEDLDCEGGLYISNKRFTCRYIGFNMNQMYKFIIYNEYL